MFEAAAKPDLGCVFGCLQFLLRSTGVAFFPVVSVVAAVKHCAESLGVRSDTEHDVKLKPPTNEDERKIKRYSLEA